MPRLTRLPRHSLILTVPFWGRDLTGPRRPGRDGPAVSPRHHRGPCARTAARQAATRSTTAKAAESFTQKHGKKNLAPHNFSFITVRGGRHEVPETAPEQALEMLRRVLSGEDF